VIALVAAVSRNRVIGRDGELPWHLPGDLAHFKALTSGATVVMGRKTYESIPPRFRPLPNRRNVVLTRNGFQANGAEVRHSLAEATQGDCFVIGGATLYAQALPLADRLHLTEVDADVEGDTFFPELPEGWHVVDEREPVTENGFRYCIRTYEKR
jgi:dihydrofolate reductase